jgi:hypothetical protein
MRPHVIPSESVRRSSTRAFVAGGGARSGGGGATGSGGSGASGAARRQVEVRVLEEEVRRLRDERRLRDAAEKDLIQELEKRCNR